MLKKQTVWLLTMLSLIIVLSVYYMTSPTPSGQLAVTTGDHHVQKNSKSAQQTSGKQTGDKNKNKMVTTNIAGQATFATAQMKKMDARSKLRTQLTQTVASSSATAQQQAQAEQKLKQLSHLSSQENMLESLIVAKGYGKDALVNVEGNKIRIYVEAKALSNKQAAQILDLVTGKLNIPTHDIYVTYKPQNQ